MEYATADELAKDHMATVEKTESKDYRERIAATLKLSSIRDFIREKEQNDPAWLQSGRESPDWWKEWATTDASPRWSWDDVEIVTTEPHGMFVNFSSGDVDHSDFVDSGVIGAYDSEGRLVSLDFPERDLWEPKAFPCYDSATDIYTVFFRQGGEVEYVRPTKDPDLVLLEDNLEWKIIGIRVTNASKRIKH